ncbi:MAG: peptidoglycan-associated lipoprotein Pal [Gemmatimonadota bacterium]
MRLRGGCRWALAVLFVVALVAAGCAKKEVVRSDEGAGKVAEAPAPAPATPSGPIVSETVKPEPAPPQEAPPAQTQTAMAEAAAGVAATEEAPSAFADIHFDFDKSFIRDDAKPVLAKVADYLKRNPSAKVRIEGNCDERGTAEYTMALGARRAESAKKYLVSLGVKAAGLSTISYGKEKPLDPGHTEEAWAKNRRDHFVLLK